MAAMSMSPWGVSAPVTTPSAPAALASMTASSRVEYTKSPPRGRIRTFTRIMPFSRTAPTISPAEGVRPPTSMPEHSSTRTAPPSRAAITSAMEVQHTSTCLVLIFYCKIILNAHAGR